VTWPLKYPLLSNIETSRFLELAPPARLSEGSSHIRIKQDGHKVLIYINRENGIKHPRDNRIRGNAVGH
jgi:hypothetical protein